MATLDRPYRGSRVSSFYPVKSLPPLSSLDSAFQLQEYISLLIRLDVHDVDAIVSLPGKAPPKDQDESIDLPEPETKKSDDSDRKTDIAVDRACWIYEQLRRLAQDLSHPLITMLQQECTRSSCPQMKAGEWLYLCVAHGNDGAMEQCCAIDYILHTVDSATALLNSPRAFPSRLSIPQASHRHFSSLARRLGRIFAHAYFHHREAFEQAEAESSLYARFLKLTNQFELVPAEFLVIPESAIHHDVKSHAEHVEPPRLLSAAVHPIPILQNNSFTAGTLVDIDARSRPSDAVHHLGMDSPRRLGRSRTDTMVFSEAYNVVEELSKNEEGARPPSGGLLDLSTGVPEQDFEARTEDMDDEDISDARSDSTLAPPLSPPVEELSLISLEDTSGVAMLPATGADDGPLALPQQSIPAIGSDPEQSDQVASSPWEHALADEHSMSTLVESAPEEASNAASELSTESTEIHPVSEESIVEPVGEYDHPIPSSDDTEPQSTESDVPSEPLPLQSEPLLELSAPPPSEPIPPESESDITDGAGELDGDEGAEEEVAVGEQNPDGHDGTASS